MKNTYFTSYFPLISIMLYSVALGIYTELNAVGLLKQVGIYRGMQEFFSAGGINLALFVVLFLIYFMLFAALKLVANTLLELSLLFFSKDRKGDNLQKIRSGSTFYLIGGVLSFLSVQAIYGIIAIFSIVTIIYFIFFVYKIYSTLTFPNLIGIVLFHTVIWSSIIITVLYLCLKLYNSILASLPI